jgi:two-component system, chemotaxis family, CheB/CheR fusion protein
VNVANNDDPGAGPEIRHFDEGKLGRALAAMHRRALEQLAPPSVLVDAMHRVVHLSENAGRFILPSGGPLSGDAVDLVRPELRFELRSALKRALEQNEPTLSLPVLVRFDSAARRVHLVVKPVHERGSHRRSAVVMFVEGEPVGQTPVADERRVDDDALRRLTHELELTQARLRIVREESDAANEELRAVNEELQSINEDYRATSEELGSSQEQLLAINEELRAVNGELKLELEGIARAHGDLQNLIAAADFATLFLDPDLRIKRFTERVTELFNITEADERRPITDFAHQLQYDDLALDARAVLANLVPIRREVRSRGGRWYDMRIRPYRTLDEKIDGVVITFVDISERHKAEATVRSNE